MWQPIETAPKDGTKVKAGISSSKHFTLVLYPLTSVWIEGKWCANFGDKHNDRFEPYEPQPTHWMPEPTSKEPTP